MATRKTKRTTHSRSVNLCVGTERGRGSKTGPVKLWAFGYKSLALLFGAEEATVRQWVKLKVFNPADLKSICDLKIKRERNTVNIARDVVNKAKDHTVPVHCGGRGCCIDSRGFRDDCTCECKLCNPRLHAALNSKDDPSWD